jgi:elongator complex protein 3
MKCHCIRCREVGITYLKNGESPDTEQVQLKRVDYRGSGGTDIFLSFEDPEHDILVGYVRIRIPTENAHRPEIARQNSSIIRELHVFGQTVPVGDRLAGAFQHKGYGSKLLAEAERISREEYDRRKILVISALGTKGYYSRFGYTHDGPYVSKSVA